MRGAEDRIRSPFGRQERNGKAILVHPLNSNKKSLPLRHYTVGFTGLSCSRAYTSRYGGPSRDCSYSAQTASEESLHFYSLSIRLTG